MILRPNIIISALCVVSCCRAFVPISKPPVTKLVTPTSLGVKSLIEPLRSRRGLFVLTAESPTTSSSTPTFTSNDDAERMEEATVEEIISVNNNKKVTLIGTAHLSKQSNAQVERIIGEAKPDVVAVELDEKRIERIGFQSIADIGIPEIVTAADIQLPETMDGTQQQKPWWQLPQFFITDMALNAVAQVTRQLLTGFYDETSEQVDSKAGGEFLAAIEACKKNNIGRLVLADRESTETIKRTAKLALESGDIFDFMNRLEQVNEEELSGLKEKVVAGLSEEEKNDEGKVTVAMMEALKADTGFRTRLFDRLEQEVPEFTTAFVKERDYIMSEAIRRELDRGDSHVVAVVGLAHVRGMKKNLEGMLGVAQSKDV